MKTTRPPHTNAPRGRAHERGVALLTVTALLAIFALIMAGFVYTIRMEEFTVQNFADSVNVQEGAESAIQGVLGQLAKDLDPSKPHQVLGVPQPRYVSQLDPWHLGYAGEVMGNIRYDARAFMLDQRSPRIVDRTGLRMLPTPIPQGVDEDPRGDVTGSTRVGQAGRGDRQPGLGGIDDNLDGVVDRLEDSNFPLAADDDEDYRVDEDQLDRRRDGLFFPAGTGYDNDNDSLGVFDESSKININFAGNNRGQGNDHVYNLGVSPNELDLEVFLFNRVVNYWTGGGIAQFGQSQAHTLAQQIVNFRYGSSSDGGQTQSRPGAENQDDDNTNSTLILEVEEFSDAFQTPNFNIEPFVIVGNDEIDDDQDGLINEEDEIYVGNTTLTSSGSPLPNGVITQRTGDLKQFRPGDRVDNDGDGAIDEEDEGIDDPTEFNIFNPHGNDRPFTSIDDLKLLDLVPSADLGSSEALSGPPSLFNILRDSTTIYSQSDEISPILSSGFNEVARINPNAAYNWRANDTFTVGGRDKIADFQYSPPMRIEDMFGIQVDLDGDWQHEAEPDVALGQPDGIDNDGDGLVDEPSGDWDGNHYPSGDFDGFAEPDVGAPRTQNNGRDDDLDGDTRDEARDEDEVIDRYRRLPEDPDDYLNRPRDEQEQIFRSGMVVEGNGQDDDFDNMIDDLGDFNGDRILTYDPEWGVSEDAWGDLSGDGYPGLGGDPEADENSAEGDIVAEPEIRDDFIVTNFADDDFDGYADFNDPQVLAAMYAPELDGVDNDGDGEVDEIGERYIAAFDDDEDGRFDEDPPQFQLAMNLYDYVDTWGPRPISEDEDVRSELSKNDDDAVLSDPVAFHTVNLYSTRQRALRMHTRLMAGPNVTSTDRDLFDEQMRLLLPNPPQVGLPVEFEGVESIRINEVLAKPVIRLEAEDVLERIQFDPANPSEPALTARRGSFQVGRRGRGGGGADNGRYQSLPANVYDTSWELAPDPVEDVSVFGHIFLPDGFTNTFNWTAPMANLDALAPAFIFAVTNVKHQPLLNPTVGLEAETATWTFDNIPAGYYDVVLYMHPEHEIHPNVKYFINDESNEYPFKSDTHIIRNGQQVAISTLTPPEQELIRRDSGLFNDGIGSPETIQLPYRLSWYPRGDFSDVSNGYSARATDHRVGRVRVGTNGTLVVRIQADPVAAAQTPDWYTTSFDRIELINPYAQYVELVNIGMDNVDLGGWTISTPYGKYVIPDETVIPRMKPAWEEDDGRLRVESDGIQGDGVPFEPLLDGRRLGNTMTSEDQFIEDNKILLMPNEALGRRMLNENYPEIALEGERIRTPEIASNERTGILASISAMTAFDPGPHPNALPGDAQFRLVDYQEDIFTHNPREKLVALYDPAGQYVDSFRYRTTFNNAVVDNPANSNVPLDIVALPGYRGMESFERTDPTYFRTEMTSDGQTVSAKRSVPSSIMLDAKDAIVYDMRPNRRTGAMTKNFIGGYADRRRGFENDFVRDNITRFTDRILAGLGEGFRDSWWNGWDFIGDYYDYPREMGRRERVSVQRLEDSMSMVREAAQRNGIEKALFYDMAGGFDNMADVPRTAPVQYTAFIWRLGVRELVRSGYDPNVDDQLTVRVLGRQYRAMSAYRGFELPWRFGAGDTGIALNANQLLPVDMPVGEVLVNPAFRVINPGENSLQRSPELDENPYNPYATAGRSRGKEPVFAKLRHGDTAYTINLRENERDLWDDLLNDSDDEPMVEIMVVIRKSTGDISFPQDAQINPALRPDFSGKLPLPLEIQPDGTIETGGGAKVAIGAPIDDNYFFKGIELFGRGRAPEARSRNDEDAFLGLLAGTPGWDNSGYVPAYPRRRYTLDGNTRDRFDVIDNTPYVKNGLLATVGEVSRLFTGNKFETVNTPIIPQRLEDAAIERGRIFPNPALAERARNDQERRIQLAQRERLDQWENQYTNVYNMVTTALNGIVPGKLNINTSSREVLSALPSTPPEEPGRLPQLLERATFNNLVADFIIEGRQPTGRDMSFGVQGLNDDELLGLERMVQYQREIDTLSEFKRKSVGREPNDFKEFRDIEQQRFNQLQLRPEDVLRTPVEFTDVFLSSPVVAPDDGPYADIGTLLSQITHLRRRERFSEALRRPLDRTLDGKPDGIGDLRERLNLELGRELTNEDIEALMNRISNLITVNSRAFGIVAQGRVFDSDDNIVAQRKLETVYLSE